MTGYEMILKNLATGSAVLVLAGCAAIASPGSPVYTSSLSPGELTGVDDYTLCKAATPRELYAPSISVMREVGRRNLNCGAMYNYTPTLNQQPQQPQQIIIQQQAPMNGAACIQDGGGTYCPYYRKR